MKTIFAKKIGMTAKYTPAGKRMGATVVWVPQIKITGMRTPAKHGYSAIMLNNKEVRIEESDLLNFKEGDEIKWEDLIKAGDKVWVSGISKGHGFTGVVKHYKFQGGPRTHGQSDRERARGSSGSTTTPGRVYRGKRMAGRMGNDKVTIKNLSVLEVNPETRQIVLSGSVPGANTKMLIITKV